MFVPPGKLKQVRKFRIDPKRSLVDHLCEIGLRVYVCIRI